MTRSKWCWLAVAVAGMLLPAVALGAASVDTKGAVTVNADDNVGDAGEFAAATASIIKEADPADITVGNIVITAPAGFEFDTASNVTATPNPGDIDLGEGAGIAVVVAPEEDTITIPVDVVSTAASTITFTGIKLRAVDCDAADATATPDITITAPGGDLTDAALIDVTITAGELAGLMFNAAVGNQVACTDFNVVVRSVDACENLVNVAADTAVAFAVKTGTGELTAAAAQIANGANTTGNVAVSYDTVEEGVVLEATAEGLTAAESSAFNVAASAAAALVVQPIATQAVDFEFEVTVLLVDACGDEIVNAGAPVTVTLARGDGTGALGGTKVRAINAGASSITFPGLTYDTAEADVTITANDGGALTDAESAAFDVIAACTEDADCDDAVFCNGAETCNLETGLCEDGELPCAAELCVEADDVCLECIDAEDCDVPADLCMVAVCEDNVCGETAKDCGDDVCNPETGACVECVAAADCDDADLCTTDTCVDLACVNTPVDCGDEFCDPATGECVECFEDAECDDGLFCNGAESCADGACAAGTPPCLIGLCDEVNDWCAPCVGDADCDDENLCTTDACVLGECVNTAVECGDEFCDPADGQCVECLEDENCDDGVFCNGAEVCADKVCAAGTAPCTAEQICLEDEDACVECVGDGDCDGQFCVDDVCVECRNAADCDDGLWCNGAETCSAAGACVAGTAPCDAAAGETCNEELDQCELCLFDIFGCYPICIPTLTLTVFGLMTLRFGRRRQA